MNAVEIKNLRKEFGSLLAVNELSFSLCAGQVLGLVGPNGAGKTTLLRMLATILRPSSGEILLFGLDARRDYLEIRSRIGYLPDFFNLYDDLTIRECLEFFASAYGVPASVIPSRVERAMFLADLTSKRDEFIRRLSRGMVQRLGLAAITVRDSELLILDEPASGLDPRARVQLCDILRGLSEEGKTIIISSHILNELAGFCTHIAIMDHGRFVVCGDVPTVHAAAVGRRRIEIGLDSGGKDAAVIIREIPGCEPINVENGRLVISVSRDSPAGPAALNAALVSRGFQVTRIVEDAQALEDIFMAVCPPGEQA